MLILSKLLTECSKNLQSEEYSSAFNTEYNSSDVSVVSAISDRLHIPLQ